MNFSAIYLIIQDGVLKELKENRKILMAKNAIHLGVLLVLSFSESEMKLTKINKIKYFVNIRTSTILNTVLQL